ncbi:hypothetical protein POVCU1_038690 [Plasmodium ovale curtisi]|uniref:Uncharacterized protein n=1 Tax=Plasmodium ovale curtisi TaxID=864141 RepID=A0A1A8WX17_PLAOA|nr:hypothetical protein POVCU1_038690 [Plasmodium ovale curtisi]
MLFLYNRHERKKQNKKEIYLCVSPLLCVDDSKKTLVHLRGKAGINGLAQGLGRTRPQRSQLIRDKKKKKKKKNKNKQNREEEYLNRI